jgi:hypothetical protein
MKTMASIHQNIKIAYTAISLITVLMLLSSLINS